MIGTDKLKVGDEVWVSSFLRGQGWVYSRHRVAKVGRKYLTLDDGCQYVIETGWRFLQNYSPDRRFLTLERRELEQDHERALAFFQFYGLDVWRDGRCDSEEQTIKRVELWKRLTSEPA